MSRPTGSKNSVPLVKWSEEEKQYLSQIANGKTHIEGMKTSRWFD